MFQRIAAITSRLQQSLESSFHDGIISGQVQSLTRCLRTYAIIDKIKDAEGLFSDIVVKPYMAEVSAAATPNDFTNETCLAIEFHVVHGSCIIVDTLLHLSLTKNVFVCRVFAD